jgi:hypothetical protein
MIVIATPTRESVTAGFAGDLVRLCRNYSDTRFMAAVGIYIANLREQCVVLAKQAGASHILFLDSDMRFPADTLDRLLAAEKHIVAANYVCRTMPEWWVARRAGLSISSLRKRGLESVDSVGCGVMLVTLSVFEALPQPWFSTPWDGQTHIGEDLYFCRQARQAGLTVWIDHDLSQQVRHQGTIEFTVESLPMEAVGSGTC